MTVRGPLGQRDSSGTGTAGYRVHATLAGDFTIETPPPSPVALSDPDATPAPTTSPDPDAGPTADPSTRHEPSPPPSATPTATANPPIAGGDPRRADRDRRHGTRRW